MGVLEQQLREALQAQLILKRQLREDLQVRLVLELQQKAALQARVGELEQQQKAALQSQVRGQEVGLQAQVVAELVPEAYVQECVCGGGGGRGILS